MIRPISWFLAVMLSGVGCLAATAATTVFFNDSQTAVPVAEGVTWDTIRCQGYQFTYTRDKLFTGGTGNVIGRPVRISWPAGLEAQAVTTPPPGVTNYKALITLTRVDGGVFDLTAFTAKLLASTAGAGGSIEIMPLLDGEDALSDPLQFNATGQYGIAFSYDESPSYLGNTATLKGFDAYKIGLYVDFALTALTLEGAAVTPSGDFDLDQDVDGSDFLSWQRGESWSLLSAEDLVSWEHNFGTIMSAAASLPVPEPSTVVMLACVALPRRPRRKPVGVGASGRRSSLTCPVQVDNRRAHGQGESGGSSHSHTNPSSGCSTAPSSRKPSFCRTAVDAFSAGRVCAKIANLSSA